MPMIKEEKLLSLLIAIGGFLTTTIIWTEYGTDPVNLPKVLVASAFGFAILATVIYFEAPIAWRCSRAPIIVVTLFLSAGVNAVLNSDAPFAQNFFGVFGRSTGFLTYLILSFFLIGSTLVRSSSGTRVILWGILVGGFINLLYCSWVIIFGDFIKWNNIYQSILGTLGNPNFVSSYLGMFNAILFAVIFLSNFHPKWKILSFLVALISLFLIKESNSIQGIAVTALSLAIAVFYFVRARFASILPSVFVGLTTLSLGGFAIAGSLNHGPLSFIHKTSVSLRGTYWEVAIKIGNAHPFTGVGFDTYGDWYRVMRPQRALVDTPPISVHSNTAHNVVLEMFGFGGWPLLISYFAIILLGLISIIRITLRQRNLEFTTVAVIGCWFAYMSQSIISINQVGLAIWGWILTGLLVAINRNTRYQLNSQNLESEPSDKKKGQKPQLISRQKLLSRNLVVGMGLIIGLFVAFPPVSADGKWRRAVESASLDQVIQSLDPSFMNPATSLKYVQAIQMFENSNLPDEAYKYAKIATSYNPNSLEAWKALYLSRFSSADEKRVSLTNMQRLDPLNPNVIAQK